MLKLFCNLVKNTNKMKQVIKDLQKDLGKKNFYVLTGLILFVFIPLYIMVL